jgi:hypothetical protein
MSNFSAFATAAAATRSAQVDVEEKNFMLAVNGVLGYGMQ